MLAEDVVNAAMRLECLHAPWERIICSLGLGLSTSAAPCSVCTFCPARVPKAMR